LREFTINAFDFHLGMQASERFGFNQDTDRDGVQNELSPEQIDNIVMYQATLSVPEKILPTEPDILQQAIAGEKLFADFKCNECHRPYLALNNNNWVFSDYDYEGNLRGEVDLTSSLLLGKRPKVVDGTVSVPVYSDFKLHDTTEGVDSQDRDALSMRTIPGSDEFFAGSSHFVTPRLWGVGNQPPYFHNGRHTSLREATEAHAGEAHKMRDSFLESDSADQEALIIFLNTLQVQQPGRVN